MIENQTQRPIIIAGPCAAESEESVRFSAEQALLHNVGIMRMSLWKPRTKPGFEGLGEEGIPLLSIVSNMGIVPATEVIMPDHAERVIDEVIKNTSNGEVIIWLGSRNQNQFIQREIGKVIEGEKRVKLLIKNQMWPDHKHWEGIVDHVVAGGADKSQLILCHRGIAPGSNGNRNTFDPKMAMTVKQNTELPMVGDPSHIAGKSKGVIDIARQMMSFEQNGMGFDGLMVEVHPNPDIAITDNGQQLSWNEFNKLQEQVIFQTA